MKKYLLVTLLACMAFTAQAKILRVNNTSGNSAPYTSISAALGEAVNGDTIMVDASDKSYGNITFDVDKKVVMIGPGYWLVKNGIVQEGMGSATLGRVMIEAAGIIIKGFDIEFMEIDMPNVVIQRCHIGSVDMYEGADNCVFHQNFITGAIQSFGGNVYHNCQITNNIFTANESRGGWGIIAGARGAYIAYNSFVRAANRYFGVTSSTIEHNILGQDGMNKWKDAESSYSDNYDFPSSSPYTGYATDVAVRETELSFSESKYGAFAGDDPYVISGVPSGPVIEDIVVPTTVEKGNTMSVTIKVGITK